MDTYKRAGIAGDTALGWPLLGTGRVGCIVLAGGEGSRLGWKGPKGTFPLSLVRHKTLFQMLAERIEALEQACGRRLPVSVMASPLNWQQTQEALPEHFEMFEQEMTPLLDKQKRPLAQYRPNGNGDVLKRFIQTGLYEKWRGLGVDYLQVVPIDNPLAEPFDPNLIGLHLQAGAEISVKAVERQSPEEKVGVIGKVEGRFKIVEYCEDPPKSWKLANTNLFCFSMDWVAKAKDLQLPLHQIKKRIDGASVYKIETFLFDLLAHASRRQVILCDRKETFAPLKERGDVDRVKHALLERDRRAFHRLSGCLPTAAVFELHPAFHYPTEALAAKWQGQPYPDVAYLEP